MRVAPRWVFQSQALAPSDAFCLTSYFQHPVVILPQVGLSELQDVVEYIYRGEISLNQSRLASFLSVSRSLQLNGLEKFIKEEVKEENMEWSGVEWMDGVDTP